jgi:uncharacterized repeat protein (TIGR03843 family)
MNASLPTSDPLRQALEQGEIELQGQFLPGSNYTFLVKVRYAGAEYPAVYKPQRGEQPLWDFQPASLAGREVAAFLVSEALGFGLVPFTLLRDGPYGPGSLQQFIDYDPEYHYFTFSPADRARLRPVALFDLLINNADRKGSHILVEKATHRIFLIDHGVCFHEQDKLRTVLWDFAGEAIPAGLLEALSAFRAQLQEASNLAGALKVYLTSRELKALAARAKGILAAGEFPLPPSGRRAYPYPPV